MSHPKGLDFGQSSFLLKIFPLLVLQGTLALGCIKLFEPALMAVSVLSSEAVCHCLSPSADGDPVGEQLLQPPEGQVQRGAVRRAGGHHHRGTYGNHGNSLTH